MKVPVLPAEAVTYACTRSGKPPTRDEPMFTGWYDDPYACWEAEMVGAGCLLVKTEVFKHIDPPWFLDTGEIQPDATPLQTTDDCYFLAKAKEAGYKAWCYTGVTADHVDYTNGIVYGFEWVSDGEGKRLHGHPAWRKLNDVVWHSWAAPVKTREDIANGDKGGSDLGPEGA